MAAHGYESRFGRLERGGELPHVWMDFFLSDEDDELYKKPATGRYLQRFEDDSIEE